MDERGVMNENAGDFRGLDRFEARKRIVEALEDAGYLEKVEPHTPLDRALLALRHGDRAVPVARSGS